MEELDLGGGGGVRLKSRDNIIKVIMGSKKEEYTVEDNITLVFAI